MENKANNKKGVTLAEVTVVLALIAILAAIPVVASFGSLDNVNAQACRASADAIFAYWKVHNRLTGDNTYTAEQAIAYCLGADSGLDSVKACPSGGVYSVQYTGGEQHKVADKVVCSVHDKKRGTIEEELRAKMQNTVDAIKNGEKPDGMHYVNNDLIRKHMYQEYGDKWPTIEIKDEHGNVTVLHIQPYYEGNVKEPPGSASEITAIFARPDPGLILPNWNTAYLYNFETKQWYRHEGANGKLITDSSFMYKSKEYLTNMLTNEQNGWKPIPNDQVSYGDWT